MNGFNSTAIPWRRALAKGKPSAVAVFAAAAILMLSAKFLFADPPSRSFEGVWRSPGHIIRLWQNNKGYLAKSITFGGRPAPNQNIPGTKWDTWGTSHLVANTLTYKIVSTVPGGKGEANVKTSKFTLSADGMGLVEISTDQLVVAGHVKSTVAHTAVQYSRVHLVPARVRK